MTTVREFGGWTMVPLPPSAVGSVRSASLAVQARLGLREPPLRIRSSPAGVMLLARHVAGFLRVGGSTIEIVPKFLADDDGADWRDAFLAILARLDRVAALPRIGGRRGDRGVPDAMGVILDDALTRAAFEGLPRHYFERRDDLAALRGRVDVERLWRRMVDPAVIPSRYSEFSDDTPVSRLLKWAARQLSSLVESPALAARLRAAADGLPQVADRPRHSLLSGSLALPAQYDFLRDAVAVATMLAEGDVLTVDQGADAPARAFLWHTAQVFEDFTFLVCREAATRLGGMASKPSSVLAVRARGKEERLTSAIPTTPDVVVDVGSWTAVLDAKYKTLRRHPKSTDVYQVMAGARVHRSARAALVYPASRRFRSVRTWTVAGEGLPVLLHAVPLDLNRMAAAQGFQDLRDHAVSLLRTWRSTERFEAAIVLGS